MTHADFVHLRVHSAYSLSEGAIKIDELIRLCDDHSMPAVAITDTGNLFGALEFALAAAKQGVQPIIGCQIAVIREDPDETFNGNGSARANGLRDLTDVLVLLAQSDAGYRNLLKLVSHSYLNSDGGAASVELADIAALSDGLIALTGGADGAVGRLLSEGQLQRARGMLESLAAVFPGRLYVEVTRHGLEIERRIEDDLVGLAYDYDLPLVASNDVHFANADMHDAHDALLCIA